MKAIKSNNVLINSKLVPACLIIQDGLIDDIILDTPAGFQGEIIDMGDLVVMPGIIDTHVHINEPGRTEWEGFNTATKAAAAGGITTVVDMPLNCIPATTTKKALQEKVEAVQGQLWVDVGFWGGAVPDQIDQLDQLLKAGVMGVKSFLIDSGVPEFQMMTEADLHKAMPIIAANQLPYLIHAEIDDGHQEEVTGVYQTFLNSRPRHWENDAISLMIALTEKYRTKTHIVHLSSSDALERIQRAKEQGLSFTVETCPHYLTLASETIKDGQTIFKCCPPIREEDNRQALWEGVKSGIIDFIVSDHSPCTPQLKLIKQGDLDKAWGGISSLQFSLSLVWTEARKKGLSIGDLSRLMSEQTAQFIGIDHLKGTIAKGKQADLVVWNPEEKFTISPDLIQHRHKVTPYEGKMVYGKVHATLLKGDFIFQENHYQGPKGSLLLRGQNV